MKRTKKSLLLALSVAMVLPTSASFAQNNVNEVNVPTEQEIEQALDTPAENDSVLMQEDKEDKSIINQNISNNTNSTESTKSIEQNRQSEESIQYIIYGAGVTEDAKGTINPLLGYNEQSKVNVINNVDFQKYLGYTPDNNVLKSSASVKFDDSQPGVKVEIVTPNNITMVSEASYVNAAITAGIKNADIKVASHEVVTGESALTAVYKAAELKGESIEPEKAQLGQEEMSVIIDVAQKAGLNEEQTQDLNDAVSEAKGEIGKLAEEKGKENITREDITIIVNNLILKYDAPIDEAEKETIIDYIMKYKDILTNEDLMANLEQLQGLTNKAKDFLDDTYQKAEESGLIDNLNNFFNGLFDSLKNLFGGN